MISEMSLAGNWEPGKRMLLGEIHDSMLVVSHFISYTEA